MITKNQIDDLLQFIPVLYPENRAIEPIVKWDGGEPSDGTFHMPWPDYDERVERFFREASKEWWLDRQYKPVEAGAMVCDDELISKANLSDIRAMLTYCQRGERFGEGHWGAMVSKGRILAILNRLQELRDEM